MALDGLGGVRASYPGKMRFLCLSTLLLICSAVIAAPTAGDDSDEIFAGPIYSEFDLTLSPGHRWEALGPLFYQQESGSQSQWAIPPLMCRTVTEDVDWSELEVLYPVLTYRRFGAEYKLQLGQLLSFSGGQSDPAVDVKKFTVFPVYFQARSSNLDENFTAFLPFGGEFKNRLFRDDIKFVMFPLYSETRKKDVITDNYLYPFFHRRRGDHLSGWQFWPVAGAEHKSPSLHTNNLDEVETIAGFDKFFALWPFFFKNRTGLGTTNEGSDFAIVPFYSTAESPLRSTTSYGWPLGYNVIDDRENKFVEHDFIWPLFVEARGSKYVNRIFPFYSHATNADLESDFYLWPFYKVNKLRAPPVERTRRRVLFFLYSDTVETNSESGGHSRLLDIWPLYRYERDAGGKERQQALSVLEPLLPNNRSVRREYSHFWSLWRAESNPATGSSSQSLLWNLYREEETPAAKKLSLLFGLFQYQSGTDGRHGRLFYLPARAGKPADGAP